MAACKFHHDRAGVGVCMRCRAVVCAACCTRLNGVNHCPACLQTLARVPADAPCRPLRAIGALLLLAGGWLVLFGISWLVAGQLSP